MLVCKIKNWNVKDIFKNLGEFTDYLKTNNIDSKDVIEIKNVFETLYKCKCGQVHSIKEIDNATKLVCPNGITSIREKSSSSWYKCPSCHEEINYYYWELVFDGSEYEKYFD